MLIILSLSSKTVSFLCVEDNYKLEIQLQLQQLLEILNSIEPHYIRYVKPNNLLIPAIFKNENIMRQLLCGVTNLYLSKSRHSHMWYTNVAITTQVNPLLTFPTA